LPYKEEQIEELINELYLESQEVNNSRLSSDYYFIYIDAKVIDLKFDDEKHVTKATHFTVVAVDEDAKKHIIYCNALKGNESLKLWKEVLNNLKNRGVTRVSMIITDDFSGVANLLNSLFPETHHQLCLVHLLRNATKHLKDQDYQYFKKTLEKIYHDASYKSGYDSFIKLCDYLDNSGYKSWSKHLRERIDNYTASLHYPEEIQKHIKSTNAVEGINNDIEIYKRNSGGYFHSQRDLMVKMRIMINHKYNHKWKKTIPIFKAKIFQINNIFKKQFNVEI
jgi:transposase-like protein